MRGSGIKKTRRNGKRILGTAVTVAALVVLSLIFMLPFLYMFFMSFMTNLESVGNPVAVFLPQGEWQFVNYVNALDEDFLTYLGNTLLIIAVNLVTVPLAASFCAFGFCRCQFKGKEFCFAVVLSTMMLPAMAVQIPLYVLYVRMQWINTPLPFIVPAIFGGGAMNHLFGAAVYAVHSRFAGRGGDHRRRQPFPRVLQYLSAFIRSYPYLHHDRRIQRNVERFYGAADVSEKAGNVYARTGGIHEIRGETERRFFPQRADGDGRFDDYPVRSDFFHLSKAADRRRCDRRGQGLTL